VNKVEEIPAPISPTTEGAAEAAALIFEAAVGVTTGVVVGADVGVLIGGDDTNVTATGDEVTEGELVLVASEVINSFTGDNVVGGGVGTLISVVGVTPIVVTSEAAADIFTDDGAGDEVGVLVCATALVKAETAMISRKKSDECFMVQQYYVNAPKVDVLLCAVQSTSDKCFPTAA
jgi:hypothetical protein